MCVCVYISTCVLYFTIWECCILFAFFFQNKFFKQHIIILRRLYIDYGPKYELNCSKIALKNVIGFVPLEPGAVCWWAENPKSRDKSRAGSPRFPAPRGGAEKYEQGGSWEFLLEPWLQLPPHNRTLPYFLSRFQPANICCLWATEVLPDRTSTDMTPKAYRLEEVKVPSDYWNSFHKLVDGGNSR